MDRGMVSGVMEGWTTGLVLWEAKEVSLSQKTLQEDEGKGGRRTPAHQFSVGSTSGHSSPSSSSPSSPSSLSI